MPGALPALKLGPISFQASGLIVGGQLVVPTGSTSGGPPAAPSAQTVMACTTANIGGLANGFIGVLGVAGNDANVLTMPGLPSANTYGDQQLDISQLQDYVSVYTIGEFYVNFEAACVFGGAVIAGTAGGVTAAGATPDARTVIGRCMQPGGISAGSTIGLVWFNIN